MKKFYFLALMVMVGLGLAFLSSVNADESRTIVKKSSVAMAADKTVVGHGGTLYMITGLASSSNCNYSVHDASGRYSNTATGQATVSNALAEGGEATQWDSFDTINFGEEGIPFNSGLVIMGTTCRVNVIYE